MDGRRPRKRRRRTTIRWSEGLWISSEPNVTSAVAEKTIGRKKKTLVFSESKRANVCVSTRRS